MAEQVKGYAVRGWIGEPTMIVVTVVTNEHRAQWWAEHQEAVNAGRECPHYYCANGEVPCRPFDAKQVERDG